MKKRTLPVRNPVARSPLLRKGGAHVPSKSGLHSQGKLATLNAIDEWLDDIDDQQQEQENGEPKLPVLFTAPATTLALHFHQNT